MSAASQDPILEPLQLLQPKLDAFNNSLPELRRENSNKPEILALCNDLQEYFSKRHKDLLSRYEILKPKQKNENAIKEEPKIEPKMKEPRKEDEDNEEEKKGEDEFCGYWIPKILPVTVPKKMLAFCRGYGQGLLKYLITHKKEHGKLRRQLPAALATVNNGASTVLRAMKDYDFSKSDTSLNDSKKTINKKMCISMLECLFPVLGSDENAPVVKYVQDMARNMAKAWREKMRLEKSLEGASKLDIQAFLQLLATFRIGKDFEQDELCEMLLQIVSLKESPALALFLGLSPRMPDFVDRLSKSGEWIEAIRYAHAFGVMDKIKPADLLKAYLEDRQKAIEDMAKKGGENPSYLLNSTTKEIIAINSVIKVVKEYNLEDMCPLAGLQNKLESLQNELERLRKVKEMGMGIGEHNLSENQRNEVNKKAASSTQEKMMVSTLEEKKASASGPEKKIMVTTPEEKKASASAPEKKIMVTTPEEKKASDARSVKEDYTIEKEPDFKGNNNRSSNGSSSNNNDNKGNKKKGPPTGCFVCGGDHYANKCPSKGTSNQQTRPKASASAPEKKMMVTTPEEKKAADAKSVKEDYTIEKEPDFKGNNSRDSKGNSRNNNDNKGIKKKGPPTGCFDCGGDHYANKCPSRGTSNQKRHHPLPPHQPVFQQRIHAALDNHQVEQQLGPIETLDFVDKLSKSGEWIEAIRYAHAFGVMDKIKPADLLKAYLKDTEKAIEDMAKKGGKNPSYLLNSTTKEITAINLVIKVVKEYNLEDMFPLAGLQNKLESLQKELERLQKVKEMRMGTGEHNLSKNQIYEVNKKAAPSTRERMMVTTPEEKKAADAKSDKEDYAIEKERLKRPRSSDSIRGNAELFETQGPADLGLYRLSQRVKYASEREMHSTTDARSHKQDYAIEMERLERPSSSQPVRGNAELFETHGPADLGLYRLSQRVKYASEREMTSTSGDKEVVPHNAGLFQNIHGSYQDDHNLSSYHGDSGNALWPSMYGSGNPGTFVTPPPTVTQTNERRGSDGYPSASCYSNINLGGSSFYGSAQINYEGRGLPSYTPTFGGVDRSSGGSSPYDIDAVANASGNPLKHGYGRGAESNISTLGGDNLSNISSSIYGTNWSSDPNNSNGRRGLDQYMLNLGAANTHSSNSSAYDLGASAVPSSNVYGPGQVQQNSGFASTTFNYGSVASATGVSGQSAINRYQFNSDLRF